MVWEFARHLQYINGTLSHRIWTTASRHNNYVATQHFSTTTCEIFSASGMSPSHMTNCRECGWDTRVSIAHAWEATHVENSRGSRENWSQIRISNPEGGRVVKVRVSGKRVQLELLWSWSCKLCMMIKGLCRSARVVLVAGNCIAFELTEFGTMQKLLRIKRRFQKSMKQQMNSCIRG